MAGSPATPAQTLSHSRTLTTTPAHSHTTHTSQREPCAEHFLRRQTYEGEGHVSATNLAQPADTRRSRAPLAEDRWKSVEGFSRKTLLADRRSMEDGRKSCGGDSAEKEVLHMVWWHFVAIDSGSLIAFTFPEIIIPHNPKSIPAVRNPAPSIWSPSCVFPPQLCGQCPLSFCPRKLYE